VCARDSCVSLVASSLAFLSDTCRRRTLSLSGTKQLDDQIYFYDDSMQTVIATVCAATILPACCQHHGYLCRY
jgi:hypothetical protein